MLRTHNHAIHFSKTSFAKSKYSGCQRGCQDARPSFFSPVQGHNRGFVSANALAYTRYVAAKKPERRDRIGVLCGGDSPERDVSLISGRRVHEALESLGYRAAKLEIDDLDDIVSALKGANCVFNCLHGGSGEDGTVQLLLDVMELPYAGSNAQACFLCMDKPRAKKVLSSKNLAVAAEVIYEPEKHELEEFCVLAKAELGLPVVFKPVSQGSSLGVRLVEEEADMLTVARQVFSEAESLFAEDFIEGRELTAGILFYDGEERALPLVEMRSKNRLFDYEAKYTEGMTKFIVPADLPDKITRRVQEQSLAAHKALGCSGFSRIDVLLAKDGAPVFLEANTLPGMTEASDLPRAAEAVGISFPRLVELMLMSAYEEVEE